MQKKTIVKAIALIGCFGWTQATFAADDVQKVTITGSNIKRAATETPSSVQILNKKEIEQSGAVSVADLMSKIPALGSNNQVDLRDGGFSKGLATASMRNLGSASTLILLNGRRISPAAYADPNQGQSTQYDLNQIPLSALERVEILKDGASAVYGSDAIAGVINFITKKDFTGAELALEVSANADGKFGRQGFNGVWGMGDLNKDKYNGFIAFDVKHRDRTALSDATATQVDQYKALTGRLTNFFSGISRYPVYYKESRPGSSSFNTFVKADLGCDPSQIRTGSTGLVPMLASDPLIGKQFCNYDGWAKEDAQGKSNAHNLLGRLEVKLGGELSAFGEFAYSRSKVEYSGVSRTMTGRSLSTVFPKVGPGISFRPVLPIGHPDNPTNGTATPARVAVAYRFEDAKGGSSNENKASRFLAGLKGSNFGWDWDTGLLYSESKRLQYSNGFLYLPIVQKLYTENVPLATIASTPGVTRDIYLEGKSSITQWDLKGSTEFGKLAGGPVGLALGIEAKEEKMTITPDPLTVNGQIVGLVNQFSNAKRNVRSAFFELQAPFHKNLEVQAAGRYDKYDGFEASFTPKLGAKWTVTPTLALRSTYSTGFRAPSLTQQVDGGTQYFLNNFEDKLRCNKPGADSLDCARSLSGVAASNKDLVPETAKSWTAGLVFSPASNLDILVDYYRIRKEKEVDLLDPVSVINNPRYADRVVRDQNQGTWLTDPATGRLIPNSGPLISIFTPYVNAGGTDTSGIDLEVNLRNNLGAWGKLSSKLSANYTLSFKKAQNQGDPMFDLVGTNGGISNDTTSIGEVARLKSSLSTTWTYNAHSLTGTMNYISGISMLARYSVQEDGSIGPYVDDKGNLAPYCQYGRPSFQPNYTKLVSPTCEVASWTTFDIAYAYTGFKNLTLGLNIRNIFNASAPYDPTYGTAGYNTAMHTPYGRYFTVKASYKF